MYVGSNGKCGMCVRATSRATTVLIPPMSSTAELHWSSRMDGCASRPAKTVADSLRFRPRGTSSPTVCCALCSRSPTESAIPRRPASSSSAARSSIGTVSVEFSRHQALTRRDDGLLANRLWTDLAIGAPRDFGVGALGVGEQPRSKPVTPSLPDEEVRYLRCIFGMGPDGERSDEYE